MHDDDGGFTLIELLVVVVVIGVLAAIAIPTFYRQREKAWRTQAVNDMKNAATALELWATDNGGDYSGADGATDAAPQLAGIEYVFRSGAGVLQVGDPGVIPC